MRKINVSGCANCPYMLVNFDNSSLEPIHISSGTCTHPSFNKSLPQMRIGPANLIEYEYRNQGDDFSGTEETGYGNPNETPQWCPLPIDN